MRRTCQRANNIRLRSIVFRLLRFKQVVISTLAELRPESDLAFGAATGFLIEYAARVERRAIKVQTDCGVRVARILYAMEAQRVAHVTDAVVLQSGALDLPQLGFGCIRIWPRVAHLM